MAAATTVSGTSRRLLRQHKNGRYWNEADMTEIYQYAP